MICVRWLPGGDYASRPPELLPPAPAALCVIARGGSAGDGPITMRVMLQGEGQGEPAREGLTPKGAEPGKDAQPSRVKPALPLHRKVCYALGGAPYQLTGNAVGFFLQIFLLDVVQLEPFHASLILFLGKAWDAVADPAIGFLVSRSPRRRWGKLIPWVVCSTPFGVFFYTMLCATTSLIPR
ncbi:Hypothetical predicted protein [Podarcis lilfordi]|uniref:Uncharacterized protein n=1 Tax=Podarcis lilfordi TaxID=74358 RepID=A0AA35PA87_9SAUR|nr:Hypothetical predicted protein [Podarcis lilfordi]